MALYPYIRLLLASYNISGGDATYVVTMGKPQELQAFQFGMTPYWDKNTMDLIHARAEGDKNPVNDPNYQGPHKSS